MVNLKLNITQISPFVRKNEEFASISTKHTLLVWNMMDSYLTDMPYFILCLCPWDFSLYHKLFHNLNNNHIQVDRNMIRQWTKKYFGDCFKDILVTRLKREGGKIVGTWLKENWLTYLIMCKLC